MFAFCLSPIAAQLYQDNSDTCEARDPVLQEATKGDKVIGISLGLLTGAGYLGKLFVNTCGESGLEMATSTLMLFTWLTSDHYQTWQKVIYAIPDLAQVAAQVYLMLACFLDGFEANINFAYFLENVIKAVQAFFLIFIVAEAFSDS